MPDLCTSLAWSSDSSEQQNSSVCVCVCASVRGGAGGRGATRPISTLQACGEPTRPTVAAGVTSNGPCSMQTSLTARSSKFGTAEKFSPRSAQQEKRAIADDLGLGALNNDVHSAAEIVLHWKIRLARASESTVLTGKQNQQGSVFNHSADTLPPTAFFVHFIAAECGGQFGLLEPLATTRSSEKKMHDKSQPIKRLQQKQPSFLRLCFTPRRSKRQT